MQKRIIAMLLMGLLIAGCSSSEKTEKAKEALKPDSDVMIAYDMIVSGLPRMGDMTFKYKFSTDGQASRMATESSVPIGKEVKNMSSSLIINLDDRAEYFLNDITEVYAKVEFPDTAQIPPSTSPETSINVEPTGKVDTLLGIQCKEITLNITTPSPAGTLSTFMTGTMWVNSDFLGYDSYRTFQMKAIDAMGKARKLQRSGPLEFLARFGMSRESLNDLYEKIDGFPFKANLQSKVNEGSSKEFTLTINMEATEISNDAIDKSYFIVPESYTEVDIRSVMMPGN